MKINLTKSLLTLLAVALVFALQAQNNPQYIWGGPNSTGAEYDNSTFNGGLNDWTVQPISCPNPDSLANCVWVWSEDGTANGAYWGGALTLTSPTQSNGCALFDSDYLDNGGTPGAFGTGPCPSPQKSALMSPSIDCSGEPNVSVLFYESYRNFQADTYIEVSNDGGNTWTRYDIPLNDKVTTNRATGGDAWTYVNISATAANQADVRIRFVWDGDYYFWLIDDVSLIRSPQTDLTIADWFYPAASYSQPWATGVACDTMGFNCVVFNTAGFEHSNVAVKVEVLDTADNVLHSETKNFATLPADPASDTVIFDNTFAPDLNPGTYRVRYSVTSDGEDFNPGDNEDGRTFVVSGNEGMEFSKGPGIASFPYPGASNDYYAVGSIYQSCDLNITDMEIAVDSFGFAVHNRDLDSLPGAIVECWLMEVVTDSSAYPNDGIDVGMNYVGWTNQHTAEFEFTSDDQDREMQWVTQFYDLNGDSSNFVFNPNKEYVALVSASVNNNSEGVAFGFSPNMNYAFGYGGMLLIDGNVYGYYTGSSAKPQIVLKLKFLVNSKLPKLPETVLQVAPNPVTEGFVNLNLQFDNPTDVAYAIGTMTGSILKSGKLNSIQKQSHSVDVSNLPNGSYLVRIQTKDGIATKQFIIAR